MKGEEKKEGGREGGKVEKNEKEKRIYGNEMPKISLETILRVFKRILKLVCAIICLLTQIVPFLQACSEAQKQIFNKDPPKSV